MGDQPSDEHPPPVRHIGEPGDRYRPDRVETLPDDADGMGAGAGVGEVTAMLAGGLVLGFSFLGQPPNNSGNAITKALIGKPHSLDLVVLLVMFMDDPISAYSPSPLLHAP